MLSRRRRFRRMVERRPPSMVAVLSRCLSNTFDEKKSRHCGRSRAKLDGESNARKLQALAQGRSVGHAPSYDNALARLPDVWTEYTCRLKSNNSHIFCKLHVVKPKGYHSMPGYCVACEQTCVLCRVESSSQLDRHLRPFTK